MTKATLGLVDGTPKTASGGGIHMTPDVRTMALTRRSVLVALGLAPVGLAIGSPAMAAEQKLGAPSHFEMKLFTTTYASLANRVNGRGYSPTSINGVYAGMYLRDASAQAIAHIAAKDDAIAQRILNYMVRDIQALGVTRAPNVLSPLLDYDIGNSVPAAPSLPPTYVAQRSTDLPLFLLMAPNYEGSQPFIPVDPTVQTLQANISNFATTGTLDASIRTDYLDPATTVAAVSVSLSELGQTTSWVTFQLPSPLTVTPDQTYFLNLQASGADDRVIWNGTSGRQGLPARVYDLSGLGGWVQTSVYTAFAINDAADTPVPLPQPPDKLLQLGGPGAVAGQEIPPLAPVTAVEVFLQRAGEQRGNLVATLRRGSGETAPVVGQVAVPVDQISATGDWVEFAFPPPLPAADETQPYFIWLEAPQAKTNSVIWYGVQDASGTLATVARAHPQAELTDVAGDASFRALTSGLQPLDDEDEVDSSYTLVLAWARYAAHQPGDHEFINATYPTIRNLADYYLTQPGYLDTQLGLLRNPVLEHSRDGRTWNAYDLITNVFASQALHELAAVIPDHDSSRAASWEKTARLIADGIHNNLTATVDGQTTYAEMIAVDQDNRFYPGYSWVNLAPIAAEWFATDEKVMRNTYLAYLKYGTVMVGPYRMLRADTGSTPPVVLGMGLAWELKLNQDSRDQNRLTDLFNFIQAYTVGDLYPESWYSLSAPTPGNSDPGNGVHSSWYVYDMMRMYPQLSRNHPTAD